MNSTCAPQLSHSTVRVALSCNVDSGNAGALTVAPQFMHSTEKPTRANDYMARGFCRLSLRSHSATTANLLGGVPHADVVRSRALGQTTYAHQRDDTTRR